MENINPKYPKRMDSVLWDPVHVQYPIRKFPDTGQSSQDLGHKWIEQPAILPKPRKISADEREFSRDHSCLQDMNRSVTCFEFDSKHGQSKRFNKHTEIAQNQYIYPPRRKLEERPPMTSVHGTTEMRSSYKVPKIGPALVNDKDEFKHPLSLSMADPFLEHWHQNQDFLDTSHEGFEKYLDPYLTTSRLHHRPFTADLLARPTNNRDIVTYYTFSDDPWVRRPKTGAGDYWLPTKLPKSMFDRETFKTDRRDIIVHNRPAWTPRSFNTEVREKFDNPKTRPQSSIYNQEEDTRFFYQRYSAKLKANEPVEDLVLKALYDTESRHVGSGRPVCSAVEQHKERNKRLQGRL